MAINPIQFLLADNATATNGSNTITIQGTTAANTNASSVFSGSAVFVGNNQVVEGISGTAFDPATNTSTITLRNNWPHPTVTGRLVVFNTIEGLADAIRRARDSAAETAAIQTVYGDVLTSTAMSIDVTINGVVVPITPYGYLEAQTTALIAEATQVVDDITAVEGRVTVVEGELDTIEGTLNGLVTSAQAAEASALTSATNSQNSAVVSQSNANYVGDWGTLPDGNPRTGALNVPASVSHNSSLWILTTNLADVTLSEPSEINSDWAVVDEGVAVFSTLADLQASNPRVNTLASVNGIEYSIDATDFGNGVTVNGLFANLIKGTTTELINSTRSVSAGDVFETVGFTTNGDGGGAKWRATGNTIAVSQTPALTENATCSDGNGNEFSLVVTQGTAAVEVSPICLGAVGAGDHTLAMQAAINSIVLSGNVMLGSNSYNVSTLNIPQGRFVGLIGEGFRCTQITGVGGGVPIINYIRTSGQVASILTIKGIQFVKLGLDQAAGSRAINYHGFGVSEDDNWIKASDCAFFGFEHAVNSGFTGQTIFEKCYFQLNLQSFSLSRGASFWNFNNCMSFDASFVVAVDPIADAYSNGLVFEACNNITSSSVCVFIQNWQSVYMSDCGWDLGSGGDAALRFDGVLDFKIENCYISGNGVAVRDGIQLNACVRGSVRDNTLVNNFGVGIRVTGSSGVATRVVIDGNRFDNNNTNDIVFASDVTASKVTNNHHSEQYSRIGTDFEIFTNTVGTDFNIIKHNTFNGVAYAILAGASSVVSENIFGTPPG